MCFIVFFSLKFTCISSFITHCPNSKFVPCFSLSRSERVCHYDELNISHWLKHYLSDHETRVWIFTIVDLKKTWFLDNIGIETFPEYIEKCLEIYDGRNQAVGVVINKMTINRDWWFQCTKLDTRLLHSCSSYTILALWVLKKKTHDNTTDDQTWKLTCNVGIVAIKERS